MQTLTQQLANPTRFMGLAARVLPWASGIAAVLIALGLYLAFFDSPADYQQGETVRIMYIHVPCAWLSMMIYGLIAMSSFGLLVFRHPLADVSAKAAAPIGAAFTFLALLTGSLWGKPMWGTYWVWDARLTSVLILFFLYLGYIALINAFDEPTRGARAGAVLALVGVVNLPIIKFSVDWWNTLHQPASVFRLGGPTIAPSMLWPLLVMALGFMLFFATVLMIRMRSALIAAKLRALRLAEIEGEERYGARAETAGSPS